MTSRIPTDMVADRTSKAKLSDTLGSMQTSINTNTSSLADNATKLGDLTQLNTTDKSSVVNALKEIKTQANSNVISINNNATAISNIGNGSPKGTYATLSALQTAYPTGTTGVYVVTADGGWYYYNGSAWAKGGTYQSTGIPNKSIQPIQTTFLSQSKNLFNKATAILNNYVSYQDGTLVSNVSYTASDYISVSPSTQYTMAPDSFLRIAYYDTGKVFISGSNAGVQTITTPSNCSFVRYSFTNASLNTQQFELGTISTSYLPYGFSLDPSAYLLDNTVDSSKLKDSTVPYNKTNFFAFDSTKNLFNGVYVNNKLSGVSGSLQYQAGDSNSKTAIIAVNPNTTYTIIRNMTSRFNYGTATTSLSTGQNLDGAINVNSSGSAESSTPISVTITTGANDKYLYVNVTTTGKNVFLQVIQGTQTYLTVNNYPFNPTGINIYNKDEVDSKIITGSQGIFNKTGSVCTIQMGKAIYTFQRVTDSSINVDAWRLYQGDLINPAMGLLVGNMWTNSDAEGAIQIQGEADFVSGYHGDEIYTSINIFSDGVLLDINTDYANMKFTNITIISESNVYHYYTSALAGTQAFTRVKTLTFKDNTVKISNRYTCLSNLTISRAAIALFNCYKTSNGTKFFNYYSTNDDLKMYQVPNLDEIATPTGSPKMTQTYLYTTIGTIDVKINKGQESPNYNGFITNFSDQNRMKIYFDYIASTPSGTPVTSGQVLQTEFQFTIK